MTIPPHRTAGEIGHIDDHNAIVDVLTGNDADIADVSTGLAQHVTGTDPHGDRAWASTRFSPTDHTHPYPVTSVQGQTGDVAISAGDIGAETPAAVNFKVDSLRKEVEENYLPLNQKGEAGGVAPLNDQGVIAPQYMPVADDSNKVTSGDVPPENPKDGDIWINTSETIPDPLPATPATYKVAYEGPSAIAYADLHPAGTIAPFPNETFPPLSFTTGPTGSTKIYVTISIVNNATATSTTLLTYSLMGDGVSIEGGFDHGGYQPPRGLQSSSTPRITVVETWDLPPNTQVTLTPMFRLSSNPSQADQDGTDNSKKLFIDPSYPPNFLVECW